MVNPVQAFVDVGQAVGPVTQSGWATFTFAITQEFKAHVPINFAMTGDFSFAPEVWVHRSTDGGASFETTGSYYRAIPNDGSAVSRTIVEDLELETGYYKIQVMAGSHQIQTFTISLTTAHVISAYA